MRNYADQVNLHARIYALRSRLLGFQDYSFLVKEQAPDFPTASAKLDSTAAKQALFVQQVAPLMGLVEACEPYTPIFLAFLRQYELGNARLLLARAFGKQSPELWCDIAPFATLGSDLLHKKLSPDQVSALLAGTYPSHDFKDISNYRRMDIRIAACAALHLYRSASALSRRAQEEFQDVMLQRVAMLAVIGSLRLKECCGWSEENIRLYREQFHDLFEGRALARAKKEQKTLDERLQKLRSTGGANPSLVDIERYLERKYYRWIASLFHRDFHSLYCVAAYLWLLFYQIKNLFCIIDGKRFGLSSDRILDKIISQT